MHREPMAADIVRVPGSDAPERVVSLDDSAMTLAPLRGTGERWIERPARESIRLVGIAAPGRKRRAPAKPATLEQAIEDHSADITLVCACGREVPEARRCYHTPTCYTCLPAPEPLPNLPPPAVESEPDIAEETEAYLERLAATDAAGGDITLVRYGSGGIDPSELF